MTSLFALLLALVAEAAGARDVDTERHDGLTLIVDSCVDVDEDEVRRLVVMELGDPRRAAAGGDVNVLVDCDLELQRVRLTAPGRNGVVSRTVDLGALAAAGRDAKNRELALTIAELVRRGENATGGEGPPYLPPPPAVPPSPLASKPAASLAAAAASRDSAAGGGMDLRLQVGLLAAFEHWRGGQRQVGPDAVGRARLTRRLSAELRLGGRRNRTVALADGALDAVAITAALGLAVDLAPDWRRAGASLGARLAGSWWWYTATSDGGGAPRAGDASALAALAGPSGFVALGSRVRLVGELDVAQALRTVTIVDQGARISALSGLGLCGALGLAAQF